jgi:two-component system cell cycle sensor histidine kinase/response regulator CckA
MADTAASPPTDRKSSSKLWSGPLARAIFLSAAVFAAAGVLAALFGGGESGAQGAVLLGGVAASAFFLILAMAAGNAAGQAMSERAARDERPGPASLALRALEASPDPSLISDLRGAPRWGNQAYRALAKRAGGLGQGFGLPAVDRIWAGSGGGDGAVYRLTRAAAEGRSATETLPDLELADGERARFALGAHPLGDGLVLWRLTPAAGASIGAVDAPLADWTQNAPVGLFSLRPKGDIASANATLRDWLGLGEGDALPNIKDILAGDGARAVLNSRGGDGLARIDGRLKGRDGIESPIALIIDWKAGGGVARGVMYGLSTTGAPPGVAQALAEPGKAGRSLDEMFAASPFGVARLDSDDPETAIVEDVNPALVQLTGGKAIPGVKFIDLFCGDDGASVSEAFASAMAGGVDPAEARIDCEPPRYVHLAFAPARGGKRVAYVIDITSWKQLERQFAQANKMQAVGQLAGGVAHDFNNLLTAIRLNCDELLGRHPVGDPSYAELQAINQTVARAAGLVRKLLAFSRKQTFRTETLEVGEVLSDFSVLLRQILEESVKLELIHGRDLPAIRADKGQLETAVMNLATNARDAMRETGGDVLTIRTSMATAEQVADAGAPNPREGDWVALEVIDTGVGMSKETLEKVFEPFFTTKEAGKGTGLGLATVYGIVKQSGGFLFADSELGKGTTFTIYLPGVEPTEEEAAEFEAANEERAAEPAPADLAGRGRILLVEDEDAVRAIAAKTLSKRGYDVSEACDGEEALEILEDLPEGEKFDLMISDVVMPGLDGPGLLKEARDMLTETRIVFISGYAEEQFSKTLSEEKDVSFLPKPFTLTQLAEKVKAELGG